MEELTQGPPSSEKKKCYLSVNTNRSLILDKDKCVMDAKRELGMLWGPLSSLFAWDGCREGISGSGDTARSTFGSAGESCRAARQ